MKKSFKEIVEILQKHIENVYDFAFQYYDPIEELGEIKEVKQQGGEGQANTWYSVKYFKDHDVYIRVDGWYSSYNGTDFDDGWNCLSEVKPITKEIIVYE
jgi:hypothetical protein